MRLAEARERIEQHKDLNAFISLTEEEGEGTVVAVKDLVDVRGTVTTGGGIILPARPVERDAPVIELMRRKAGVVVVGKANLHEWAYGATSNNPHYGPVRNPRDPERVAGGSSGGSAVAVACGMCDWALGSDTGGSIRVPASFCGVVGFKPTLGMVDTEGVIPLSRSLDTLGPLAPDVASAAHALEAMSDLSDLVPARARPRDALAVGVPRGWVGQLKLDETTARVWARVSAGLPEVDFPDRVALHDAGAVILAAEAFAFHRRWLEAHPDKYGDDVRALLEQGSRLDRGRYVDALLQQSRLRAEAEAAMQEQRLDALLLPAVPYVAPRIGEALERGTLLGLTRPFNTTGQPVICLPAASDGLPVGVQLVGGFGREARLVEVAMAYEGALANPERQG
jgi:aspartyl-tRNA(Asn)/glutamyl-tRNA(Gln) amidotransferase subunit A